MKWKFAPRSNLGKGKFGKAGAAQLCGSPEPKLGTQDLHRKSTDFLFSLFKKLP